VAYTPAQRLKRLIELARIAEQHQSARIKEARSQPTSLRAAAMRVTTDGDRDQLRALATLKQNWQGLAWNYRDMIGELRYALQFRARALSRVHFYAAEIPSGAEDEPLDLDLRNSDDPEVAKRITLPPALCEAAERELGRLPLSDGMGFVGVWSENFDVAGECWLLGSVNPLTGEEQWKIYSVSRIEIAPNGAIYLKDAAAPGGRRKLVLDENSGTELYRLYVPHPENTDLADSSLRACLDSLEDIVLAGREMRAAARSRIAANGILFLPFGLMMPTGTRVEEDPNSIDPAENSFAADFTGAYLAPITNEGDAGAMAPVIVTGHRDDIAAVRHERLDREDSPTLIAKLDKALSRMANSIDIPPEILTGMAEVNHWTAWQIDASTARHHLEPGVRLMADSLTGAFVRAALIKQGFAPEDVKRVRVWFSMGNLTENPNRRQDALDAAAHAAISLKSLREALGFNEEDAPSQSELLQMIAMKSGLDAAWVAQILTWYAEQEDPEGTRGLPSPPMSGTAGSTAPQAPGRPPERPSIGSPSGGPPSTAPSAIAASAGPTVHTGTSGREKSIIPSGRSEPRYRLVHNELMRVVEADRALREQITAAADAAIERAIERAGGRLRSKISADRELSLRVRDVQRFALCAHLGRTETFARADLDFLLSEAFDGLRDKFLTLVTAGISNVAARVLRILGLPDGSRQAAKAERDMVNTMRARLDVGWEYLHQALRARTEKALFGEDVQDDGVGELADTILPPAVVRAALSIVGGLPETSGGVDDRGRSITGEPLGGLANGDAVRREFDDAGAMDLGYTWVYGITPQTRKFDPHWDLEGKRFTGWTDEVLTTNVRDGRYAFVGPYFHPGDHAGCMCDYVPGYALPAYGAQVDAALRTPSAAMAGIIKLAESDDRAGRKGTTAQYERDRWQEVQDLQARFMKGEAA
jgi:hypothetical protein